MSTILKLEGNDRNRHGNHVCSVCRYPVIGSRFKEVRARFSLCNQCYSEGKVPPSFKPEEYRFREYGSEVDNIEGDVDDESSSDGDSADSEFQVEEEEEVLPLIQFLPLLNLVPAPVQRERGKLLWEIWEQEDTKWIDEHKTEDGDLDQLITETTEPPPDLIMPLLRYQKEFLAWATKQEQSADPLFSCSL
ncbi:hypothetical protein Bca4012_069766 [Brassica carinata]